MKYQLRTLDSRSELEENFRQLADPKILIENKGSNPNQFLLLKAGDLAIAIADRTFGVPIQIDSFDNNSYILLGHESEILCASRAPARIQWSVALNSVFFEFKILQGKRVVVIIEETGVVAVDFSGKKIWAISTDILARHEVTESTILLETIDGVKLQLSSPTGQILSREEPKSPDPDQLKS